MPASELEGAGRAHGLQIEKVGTNVVLRRPSDDDGDERQFLGSVPSSPGSSSVFATGAALRCPDFFSALGEACRVATSTQAGEAARGPRRVWVAVSGLTARG